MEKYLIRFILIMALLYAFEKKSLEAWNSTGHMVVVEIAKRQLTPQAKEEVERLIHVLNPFYPETSSLLTAATWADSLREHGMNAFNQWHYTVMPYDPEHFLTAKDLARIQSEQKDNNVQWALDQAINTLKSEKAGDFEKAIMLRFLLHFIADIHQPMHSTTLYSKKFPQGDRGGNLYKIKATDQNLHWYWDGGAGLFQMVEGPMDETKQAYIESLAEEATSTYPFELALENLETNTAFWVEESHACAIEVSYSIPEGTAPTEEYIQQAQLTTKTRIALAGYRLAYLLNSLFKESKE